MLTFLYNIKTYAFRTYLLYLRCHNNMKPTQTYQAAIVVIVILEPPVSRSYYALFQLLCQHAHTAVQGILMFSVVIGNEG